MISKTILRYLKQNWLLLGVLFLAAGLRLFWLGKMPPALHWDETAIGYNAYSILKTGRDEYGHFLPLIFKSFGDYKPGLYVYLVVPFIVGLGLTELAVRLPSALIGIATVWLLYQVVVLFFSPKGRAASGGGKRLLALFAAFTLAFCPWHLQFSRGAWEANVALFFILGGIYCFLRTQRNSTGWLYLAALSLGAAVWTYQGGKLMVPLVVLGLLICFWEKSKKLAGKHLIASGTLLFLISFPILLPVFTGGGGRLKVMSVFSYRRPQEKILQIAQEDKASLKDPVFKLFHSESLNFARGILERYFNHFAGKFLFFEGDWSNSRHGVPYAGVLYYIDFIFFLGGLYWLTRQKAAGEKFIWYWLLVSPLPAALSRDAIQAVRSLNMVLPLSIIVGSGMYQVYLWISKQRELIRATCYLLLIVCCLWCFIYYLDQYYVHYPFQSSKYWQYGYKNVVNKIYPIKDNYSRIIFTQKWGQPYIYWLFYSQYDPLSYQKQADLIESPYGDVGEIEKIDNLEFRDIYWPSDRSLKKSLFIGGEYEVPLKDIDPDQARFLDEIRFLNGEVAFRIVETL